MLGEGKRERVVVSERLQMIRPALYRLSVVFEPFAAFMVAGFLYWTIY